MCLSLVHIYIYVYMFIYMCIYTHVSIMYISIYVHMYIFIYMCIYMHTHIYVSITGIYIYICVYVYICVYIYTHIYMCLSCSVSMRLNGQREERRAHTCIGTWVYRCVCFLHVSTHTPVYMFMYVCARICVCVNKYTLSITDNKYIYIKPRLYINALCIYRWVQMHV